MQTVQNITESIHYVGCNDRRLEKFENIFPLPNGISYNSFLINDEKTAILDTVDSSVTEQFLENVQGALAGRDLDYIVVNHMEPDHCGNIVELSRLYPNGKIVANKKALNFLDQFYPQVDLKENYHQVKEGDTLSLGKHELTFIFAPMVHWPEVMFTYEKTEKILFSADAFGTFGALHGNLFADELDYDLLYGEECRRYYTNIVGKYGKQVTKAMGKVSEFDVQMIAPLHGPIWRKDTSYLWDRYTKWSAYEPEKKGVVLVYASIYGNTASAIDYLATRLSNLGVTDLRIYDVSKTHPSYIIADIFKFTHVIISSSTYNLNIFPPMKAFLDEMAQLDIQNKKYALIGNGSWSPTATKQLTQFFAEFKNWENIAEPITLSTTLSETQKNEFDQLAAGIAASVSA
ncbi:FprA family A-type flavoprotein [Enterococcus sp. HY326]|uniref:FprA family A-type flavoprotein n=1 Tax=Enterococcus sp. HY326 TaxID=2971265 RepID=UPI00223F6E74|nr:FprA family A-type flavoprotein [Enterococcus sp. HY326]